MPTNNTGLTKNKTRLIALISTIIILLVAVLIVAHMPNINRARTVRALRGHWIEYSNNDYLTTLEFSRHNRFDVFEAHVYTAFNQRGDRLIPIGPISGMPWGHDPVEAGDSYVTYVIRQSVSMGAFSLFTNGQLVLYFSDAPPGRDRPYAVEMLSFNVTRDRLALRGDHIAITFVRM